MSPIPEFLQSGPDPKGIAENSRGLSTATPPDHNPPHPSTPKGVPESWSRFQSHITATLSLLAATFLCLIGCTADSKSIVVYTSQDQIYAEPIFAAFTASTGIRVLPVFDNEAVKTVGLVNRLIAEKDNPQCDLFWNNEELRTRMLAVKGLFAQSNGWRSAGLRSRRIVVNQNLVPPDNRPHSFLELTNVIWKGRVALSYPLFGTTATHFMALRQKLGDQPWQDWCNALAANKPFLVDGNSMVVKMVGRGEALVGMTDSDDIYAGKADGLPIEAVAFSDDGLMIANTIATIRNAPHAALASQLRDFLQQPRILKQLQETGALETSASPASSAGLQPDWPSLVADIEPITEQLKRIFLR
ncbi:MAG: extracellular solute-binding protein family 1 [Verrucomicrobiales bacterium]|nr:extracellular solute-binding protein family 1 [Verrucomicrobiales bacterium]